MLNHRHPSPPKATGTGVEAWVLAGGLSRRMGRDKSRIRLSGRTLLDLSRDLPRHLGLRHRVIRRDVVNRCGPLGGILTALRRSTAPALLFLACDTPFLPQSLARRILRRWQSQSKPVFTVHQGRVGFPFLLPRSVAPVVQHQVAQGALSLQDLARQLKALRVQPAARECRNLVNINNPKDLAQARKILNPGPPRRGATPKSSTSHKASS